MHALAQKVVFGCLADASVQAAVRCSTVGELPDRLQDYRTTASYLSKIVILTSSAYMSSQVRGEEKWLKYSQSAPGPG